MNASKEINQGLGKKETFTLSKFFKKEACDFTPWLAENLHLISEAIGIKIINPSTEQYSDNFRVDIKAELEDGSKVVIENQFGAANHDHLGKIITYKFTHKANVAIWVVEQAKQDHINTINALNESDCGCAFFLLKAQLIRIDNSRLAPEINMIAGPSKEIFKRIKSSVKSVKHSKMLKKFWVTILKEFKSDKQLLTIFKRNTARESQTIDKEITAGVFCSLKLTKDSMTCRIYIYNGKESNDKTVEIFNALKESKDIIEKRFGHKLEWEIKKGHAAIGYEMPGGWGDPVDKWPEIAKRDLEIVKTFVKAFEKPIDSLKN